MNCAIASSQRIFLNIWFNAGKMDYIIISGAASSPFLYFVFVAIIYSMTIQHRINNIYNNYNASAIRHNILRCGEWQKHNYLDIL